MIAGWACAMLGLFVVSFVCAVMWALLGFGWVRA
jgi:hypothetical protein